MSFFEEVMGAEAPQEAPTQKQAPMRTGASFFDEINEGASDPMGTGAPSALPSAPREKLTGVFSPFMAGLKSGATEELPGMVQKAGRFVGALPTPGVEELKAEQQAEAQRQPKFGGWLSEQMYRAGQMMPASLAPSLAGAGTGAAIGALGGGVGAIPGAIVGGLAGAGLFGTSQAQETKEQAMRMGVDPGNAPLWTGLIEGGGEAASNLIPLGFLGKMFKEPAKAGLRQVAQVGKNLLGITAGEVLPEMGQSGFEALVEKQAGIRPDADPWGEAKASIAPTLIMSTLLGGAGAGASRMHRYAQDRAATKAGEQYAGEGTFFDEVNGLEQTTPEQWANFGQQFGGRGSRSGGIAEDLVTAPAPVVPGAGALPQTPDTWATQIKEAMAGPEDLLTTPYETTQGFSVNEEAMSRPTTVGLTPTPEMALPVEETPKRERSGALPVETLEPINEAAMGRMEIGRRAKDLMPPTSPMVAEPRAPQAVPEKKPPAPTYRYDQAPLDLDTFGVEDKSGKITKQLEPLRSLPYNELKSAVQDLGVKVEGNPAPTELMKQAALTLEERYPSTVDVPAGIQRKRSYPSVPNEAKQRVDEKMQVWEGLKSNKDIISKATSAYPELTSALQSDKPMKRSDILSAVRSHLETIEVGQKVPTQRKPVVSMTEKPVLESVQNMDKWATIDQITKGDSVARNKLMSLVDKGAVIQAVDQGGTPYFARAGKGMPSFLQVPELEEPMAFKAPTKPVDEGLTAEKATAIHWSNKPLTTVYGAGKKNIQPAGYSRADIQRRMNQSSEYMPDPEQAVDGYTKGQLKKLGKYSSEVFATYNPKTSKDVFAGTQRVPNAIEIENHYDADKDRMGLWPKAKSIAGSTGYDAHNVFSNLVRQAGFPGYVQNAPIKGERWSVSLDQAKATPPTLGRVMESEAVQGATKTPKNLRETLVRAVSEVQRQNRKIVEAVAKNYPEATVGHSVMSAYRGAESSSQYENSFDTFIEAPIQTLRAIASRFALEHQQESTVVQITPNKEFPANGVNVAYDFPAGTKADDIEAAMTSAGLSDYRVISNTNNDKLSVHYFVFGDENAEATVDKFEAIYKKMGVQGSIRKGSIYSEFIGKDEYEKHLSNYHGATEAGTIYRQGQQKGKLHAHAEATRKGGGLQGRSGAKPLKGSGASTEVLNFKPAPPSYAPTKTKTAYKLFRVNKKGNLKPLFIGAKETIPIGKWMLAENLPTKGFAPRPGWHAGSLPQASHLTEKGRVWAEVEIPADRDWQEMASASPTKDIRDQVPEGGYYRFPRPQHQGGEWLVAGAMKVKRILSPEQVKEIREETEISYKLPKTNQELADELELLRAEGLNPIEYFNSNLSIDEMVKREGKKGGAVVLAGDTVLYGMVYNPETGQLDLSPHYFGVNYPKANFESNELVWATSIGGDTSIKRMFEKHNADMAFITIYPNLVGQMDTNPQYQENLLQSMYAAYGRDQVQEKVLEHANKLVADRKAKTEKEIEQAQAKAGKVFTQQEIDRYRQDNNFKSLGHVLVTKYQSKDWKLQLLPGQKKPSLEGVARATADPAYKERLGEIVAVASIKSFQRPPKTDKKTGKALEPDLRVHAGHEAVERYPVEINGGSIFYLPKKVKLVDLLDDYNRRLLKKVKEQDVGRPPKGEREDYQKTKDEWFEEHGFPPSGEAGSMARVASRREHIKIIQAAIKDGKRIPYDVLVSYKNESSNFARDQLALRDAKGRIIKDANGKPVDGYINTGGIWMAARNMTAFVTSSKHPLASMLLEAGKGNISAWKQFTDAKSMAAFSDKWMKEHPEYEYKFKLDRMVQFVEDVFPKAATPSGYKEMVQDAKESGFLTPEEWDEANLETFLDRADTVSIDRDYIVDYLNFRDSVYKRMAEEKADPTKVLLSNVEKIMKNQGLNVSLKAANLSNKNMQDFITRFGYLFGQKIHFVDVKGDFEFYGLHRGRDILLNTKSQDPHLYVLGHEMVHALRLEHPDLYDQLFNTIQVDPTLYAKYLAKTQEQYARTSAAEDIDKLREEIVGDIMGEMFMEKAFWRTLGEQNPSLLNQLYDTLLKIYNRIVAYFGNDQSATAMLVDYDAVLNKATEVMSAFRNRIEFAEQEMADARELNFKVADNIAKMVNVGLPGKKATSAKFTSVNPTAQARFNEAKLKGRTRWDQWRDAAIKTVNEFRRHFPKLDPVKDAEITEALYQHEIAATRSRARAVRELQDVTKGMDANQYEVFRYATILPDLLKYVEAHSANFKDGLPFGYNTIEEIRADADMAQRLANSDRVISGAQAKRKDLLNNMRKQLVKQKILHESVVDNEDYFHHQVLAYLGAKDMEEEYDMSTPSDVRKHKYGWMMARKGSSKDFNTEYTQAEYEVLSQAYTQLAAVSALKKIQKLDQSSALQVEADATGKSVAELAREKGLSAWQPEQGNFLYKAMTISDRLINKVLKGLDGELNERQETALYDQFADKDFRKVLAMGGKKPTWYLPTNVKETLDTLTTPTEESMLGKASSGVMTWWKKWILLNPVRALKYTMNNLTGDLDIAFAYDHKILTKHGVKAAKDLMAFTKNKAIPESLKRELLKAERKGVIGSGITAVEITDLDKLGAFRALSGKRQGLYGKYMENVQKWSTFRENILRLAAYRYFQEKVSQSPDGGVYGASNKEAIDAIANPDDRAAKLARELIGDYGNVSHAGQFLRRHLIPFYSWLEVNAPRYVRLMRNVKDDKQVGTLGFTGPLAMRMGMLGVKAAGLYAAVALWNVMMFPDEDEEMKRNGRKQLHLILGRTPDGAIRSIRFQGALSDALSWFGMEQPDKTVADVVSGKKSFWKQLKESALATPNKLALGSAPFMRTALEAATGKSLFPDMMRPKPIRDRTEHILRSVSMDMPYRYFNGIPTRGIDTDLLSSVFAYSDPGEAAYYHSLQKMGEYLESVHKEKPPGQPTAKSNALYYYKQARKFGDRKLAEEWLAKYKKLGGTSRGILISVKKSDPMAFLPRSERAKYLATLDEEDRRTLADARKWWKRTYRGSSMYNS